MSTEYTLGPSPDAVRISGVITGYSATRPAGLLVDAPTLQVRVQEVISGDIREGDAEVAPLEFGTDCLSTPSERQTLEEIFPVGTPVFVFGVARVSEAGTAIVVVEKNRSRYVWPIPPSVTRTSYGDVDFQRSDARGAFGDFEYARVILTLPKTAAPDLASRLRNLAYYYWFRLMRANQISWRRAREIYGRIVSNSGVSPAEGLALLDDFDRIHQRP